MLASPNLPAPAQLEDGPARTLQRRDVVALLCLLLLDLVLLARPIFLGEAFYERDIHLEWFSQVEAFVRAVSVGAWPLWDNAIAFGQPLLADPSAQVLYPPTWLNLFLLPWTYYTLFVAAHLFFSGCGVYALARAWKLSRVAGTAAAAMWMLSGPLVSMFNLWHHFAGAAWMPWVLFAAHRALHVPDTRRRVVLGLASGLQILAGSADMAALSAGLVALYALWNGNWKQPLASTTNHRALGTLATSWLLATAVTAVLWLPTIEAARRSARWDLPEPQRLSWSVTPFGLAQVAWPFDLLDSPIRPEAQAELTDSPVGPFLRSHYLGLSVLVLAALGLWKGKRRLGGFLGTCIVGAILVGMGRHLPFYDLLAGLLPAIKIFRYPSKVMIVAALASALLAGLGIDAWVRGRSRLKTGWALGLVSVVLGATTVAVSWVTSSATAAWLFPPEVDSTLVAETLATVARGFVVSGAAAGLLLVAAALAPGRTAAGAVLAALLAVADLYGAHRELHKFVARELFAFRPPVIKHIEPVAHERLFVYDYYLHPGSSERYLGRSEPYPLGPAAARHPLHISQVLSQRLYPFPPTSGRWGFEGSFDVDTRGLYSRELHTLVQLRRSAEGTPGHTRLLRLGAVGHVVALHRQGLEDLEPVASLPSLFPEPILVLRVPDALPRVYAVGTTRPATTRRAAIAALLDARFDPATSAVVASGPAMGPVVGFRGTAHIVDRRPDRIRIEARLSHPGLVVLVDTYDPGWKATVNGRPAVVERVNLSFRGVGLPAGRHLIEYAYRPRGFLVGAALSGVTWLALAIWWLSGIPLSRAIRPERTVTDSAL